MHCTALHTLLSAVSSRRAAEYTTGREPYEHDAPASVYPGSAYVNALAGASGSLARQSEILIVRERQRVADAVAQLEIPSIRRFGMSHSSSIPFLADVLFMNRSRLHTNLDTHLGRQVDPSGAKA